MQSSEDARPDRPGPSPGPSQDARAERGARARELAALVDLLADPSPSVARRVARALRGHGKAARAALRRASRSADPRRRARARSALLEFERARALRRLGAYLARDEVDLERGLWLLARLEDPLLDARPYISALDALGTRVRERAEARPIGLARARVLVEVLADELGYTGADDDYHHPDNVFLHRALVRKRGLPLTLAAIHVLVGRRAQIEAWPVPLPGHVFLRLCADGARMLVDPFHGGAVRSEQELLAYLAQNRLPFHPRWFRNADDRSMLLRQMANLANSWRQCRLVREAAALEALLASLRGAAGARVAGASDSGGSKPTRAGGSA